MATTDLNPWLAIFRKIDTAAAIEQLAEEAAELAAAASKMARVDRGENPARTTWSQAFLKLQEELADTLNAAAVLDSGWHGGLYHNLDWTRERKMQRWYDSLFGGEDAE